MLFDTIKKDQIQARKSKSQTKVSILTTLIGDLESLAKRENCQITDDLVVRTCKKFLSNNNETIKVVTDSSQKDMLAEENTYLEVYVPKQMNEGELRVVLETVRGKSLGEIMKFLKEIYNGQYDGKMASALAKEYV